MLFHFLFPTFVQYVHKNKGGYMHKKQTVGISWLPIRLGLFCLLIFAPQLLLAQEDNTRITFDSLRLKPEGNFRLPKLQPVPPSQSAAYPLPPAMELPQLPKFTLKESSAPPYYTNPSPLFRGDYSTGGILRQFTNGALIGSGSQTSLPGIGRFNEASLGYNHVFSSAFELQLRANTMKINMSRITGQAFSTSGALIYHASDRLAFKVFGSYDIGNSYGMSTHRYGATMSLDMTDRFGMELGVQRYYDAMRGRWETVPIAIPYYRFEKFKLGLDVGGILFEVLRNAVFDKRGGVFDGGGGPTIRPPSFSFPMR